MLVVVLCGGKGTRLGKLNKCMTQVAGRPFIEWKKDNLRALGHPEFDWLFLVGQHQTFGDRLEHFARDAGVGRGKALAETRDCLAPWFWLTYGDTLLSYPRERVESVHKKTGRAVATVTKTGRDYGAMIVPRDCWDGRPFAEVIRDVNPLGFPVSEPWHHINTPDDLDETEAWLSGKGGDNANLRGYGLTG